MSGASTSTYPENLGSGGLIPAEVRGRVCLFFVCPSRYDARHRKPRRCVYALKLGGTGISPPDSFRFRSHFCSRSRSRSPDKNPPDPGHPTSGDIFYCSGRPSRQLNHSSLYLYLVPRSWLRRHGDASQRGSKSTKINSGRGFAPDPTGELTALPRPTAVLSTRY